MVGDLRKTGLDDGTISFPHTSEGRRVYSQIHARVLMVCRVVYLGFHFGVLWRSDYGRVVLHACCHVYE